MGAIQRRQRQSKGNPEKTSSGYSGRLLGGGQEEPLQFPDPLESLAESLTEQVGIRIRAADLFQLGLFAVVNLIALFPVFVDLNLPVPADCKDVKPQKMQAFPGVPRFRAAQTFGITGACPGPKNEGFFEKLSRISAENVKQGKAKQQTEDKKILQAKQALEKDLLNSPSQLK